MLPSLGLERQPSLLALRSQFLLTKEAVKTRQFLAF
jgi:hypothetical protein